MSVKLSDVQQEILNGLVSRRPDLECCVPGLMDLHALLVATYDNEGTLFTCGNGGSSADALHIAGEMNKSFERKRPIPAALAERLRALPLGADLAAHLESGLRAHALGFSGALRTAVENDIPVPGIAFAQELNALVRSGDVLLAISTSGNAANCRMAMSVAQAHDATAVVLTGLKGGAMAEEGAVVIKAPGDSTKVIQEAHIALWHTMCLLIEAQYFPEMR